MTRLRLRPHDRPMRRCDRWPGTGGHVDVICRCSSSNVRLISSTSRVNMSFFNLSSHNSRRSWLLDLCENGVRATCCVTHAAVGRHFTSNVDIDYMHTHTHTPVKTQKLQVLTLILLWQLTTGQGYYCSGPLAFNEQHHLQISVVDLWCGWSSSSMVKFFTQLLMVCLSWLAEVTFCAAGLQECRVLQGSELCPILFIMYTADLIRLIKEHGFGRLVYADIWLSQYISHAWPTAASVGVHQQHAQLGCSPTD